MPLLEVEGQTPSSVEPWKNSRTSPVCALANETLTLPLNVMVAVEPLNVIVHAPIDDAARTFLRSALCGAGPDEVAANFTLTPAATLLAGYVKVAPETLPDVGNETLPPLAETVDEVESFAVDVVVEPPQAAVIAATSVSAAARRMVRIFIFLLLYGSATCCDCGLVTCQYKLRDERH